MVPEFRTTLREGQRDKMGKHMKKLLVAAVLVGVIFLDGDAGAKERVVSSIKIKDIDFKDARVLDILQSIARKHKVVIGLSGIATNPHVINDTVDISIHQGTLKDVLDALAKARPEYTWEQGEDGVVRVQVGTALPLAVLPIKAVDIENETRDSVAREIFRNTSEIKSWLQEQNCMLLQNTGSIGGIETRYVVDPKTFTFHFNNERLDSILSTVAREEKTFFWYVIHNKSTTGACGLYVQIESSILTRHSH